MSEAGETPEKDVVKDDVIQLRTVSTVEAAAEALREMILGGQLETGARLRETEFSERLGVARHTFRAATQSLVAEGLLRRLPNKGVQLAILDADDIHDIFKLRAALELEAVRLAIEGEVPLETAGRAVDTLNGLGDDATWREVVNADMAFHEGLVNAAGSDRLSRAYKNLQSEIALCMAQLRPHYDSPSEVAAEHRELLEPLLTHDVATAEERFRAHLDDAEATLTEALEAAREETTEE